MPPPRGGEVCAMNYRVRPPAGPPILFGSSEQAHGYARLVKGTVEPVDGDALPPPSVTLCPPADRDAVETSTKAYLDRHWNPWADRLPRPKPYERPRGPLATFGDVLRRRSAA